LRPPNGKSRPKPAPMGTESLAALACGVLSLQPSESYCLRLPNGVVLVVAEGESGSELSLWYRERESRIVRA